MPGYEKVLSFRGSSLDVVPRPGVEPGLEVPETSVMSFSLPGREQMESIAYPASADKLGLRRLAERQDVAVEVPHFDFPDPIKLQTRRSGDARALRAEFRVQRVNIFDP